MKPKFHPIHYIILLVLISFVSFVIIDRYDPRTAIKIDEQNSSTVDHCFRSSGAQRYLLCGKQDINSVGYDELEAVPGIGPVIAKQIIDRRQISSKFTDWSQLDDIHGIGEKKISLLKEYLFIVK